MILIQNLLFFAALIMPFRGMIYLQLQKSPVFSFYLLSPNNSLLFNRTNEYN